MYFVIKPKDIVLIVAKCNVNVDKRYDEIPEWILIVAKCNVNVRPKIHLLLRQVVLIVAKCNVNTGRTRVITAVSIKY